MRANYKFYDGERVRANTAGAQLLPSLRLFSDKSTEPSCFQTGVIEKVGFYTLCRVVIANGGPKNVRARVTIRRVPPEPIDRVPLRIAHNRSDPPPEIVEVFAHDQVQMDVIDQIDARGVHTDRIDLLDTALCYTIGRGPLPCEPMSLDIVVGGDVQELVARFSVEFSENLRLLPLRQI